MSRRLVVCSSSTFIKSQTSLSLSGLSSVRISLISLADSTEFVISSGFWTIPLIRSPIVFGSSFGGGVTVSIIETSPEC
ncbi:MAG: hypothetical protein AB7U98_07420 [Candidatus Nitrosocosmicus sp.]